MFEDAAKSEGVSNPFPRTAYTPDIYNWAKNKGILIRGDARRPQAGDVFLVKGAERVHHVGFVRSVESNSWTSVEGNSNSDGSREGYEVACNSGKPFASRFYWVRIASLLEETATTKPDTKPASNSHARSQDCSARLSRHAQRQGD